MPTIDDLRDVLREREIHAGDPDVVLDRLHDAPRRRRTVAPVLAAAVVVALAIAAAGFIAIRTRSENTAGGSNTVRWHVSVGQVPGYEFTRTEHLPQYEMGLIEFTGRAGLEGTFWRYASGAYTPITTGGAHIGTPMTIHGAIGHFSGTAKGSQLAWQYAPGAWAVVAGRWIDAAGSKSSLDAARDAELTIARAMRFGPSQPVKLPFQLRDLPSNLTFQAAYPHGGTNCVGYGAGDALPAPKAGDKPDDYGTVLTVCRVHAGDTTWVAGDRWIVRRLPDGTDLTVVVHRGRLDVVGAAQARQIASRADVSPTFDAPGTWLPIRL